jgi:hypothetical protein
MDPDQYFRQVLRSLRPLFRENGFRPRAQNFLLESPECWAIVNFQKSRWSDAHEKTFYINVAIAIKRLLEFDGEAKDKAPAYYACPWNLRAEVLGPDPSVQHWTVRDSQSAIQVVESLKPLMDDFVIPSLKLRMTEEAFLRMWKDGTRLGYPQLKAKSALLAATGEIAELESTLRVLQERFGSGAVQAGVAAHMASLHKAFPEAMTKIQS